MSPRGPGAVALTLGFTSLRSHLVPSLRWGCEDTINLNILASFSAPWCHLSDGCHLTHDYGTYDRPRSITLVPGMYSTVRLLYSYQVPGT